MSGRFITFEGGEGAGKSTQIKLLSDSLERAGIHHIVTREPGGTQGAEDIRELIVTGDPGRWDPVTETLLICAARHHHVSEVIQPKLNEGVWVLCDRFYDSTRIYQGISKNVGLEWLDQLHHMLFGNLTPDMTILLDIKPEKGLARAGKRNNNETRFEDSPLAFHEMVRKGFLDMAKCEPSRFSVISADKDIDAIQAQIHAALKQQFAISLEVAA